MGQKKIIIYCDSFADPDHRKIDHPEITAWYDGDSMEEDLSFWRDKTGNNHLGIIVNDTGIGKYVGCT